MPVHFEIDEDVLVLRMLGQYELGDIHAALLNGLVQSEAAPLRGLLFDVRGSEALHTRATDEVRDMARFLAAQGRRFGGRLALLATADYAYGLMRLGSVLVEQAGVSAAVFRNEPEARQWLHM